MKPAMLKLDIKERINLPLILPTQAKHETGRLCVEIRKKLAFDKSDYKEAPKSATPEELDKLVRKFGIVLFQAPDGPRLRWDQSRKFEYDIHFSAAQFYLIVTRAREMNTKETLPTTDEWVRLYEKILKAANVQEGKKKPQPGKKGPNHA